MDVPSTAAGIVREVKVKVGTRSAMAACLLLLEPLESKAPEAKPSAAIPAQATAVVLAVKAPEAPQISASTPQPLPAPPPPVNGASLPHASPSIRRFAREFGVDLTRVSGTGPKGRICTATSRPS